MSEFSENEIHTHTQTHYTHKHVDRERGRETVSYYSLSPCFSLLSAGFTAGCHQTPTGLNIYNVNSPTTYL